ELVTQNTFGLIAWRLNVRSICCRTPEDLSVRTKGNSASSCNDMAFTSRKRVSWNHRRHDLITEDFGACDCVSNRRIKDETDLGGAVGQSFDCLVRATHCHVEQDVRVPHVELMQCRRNKAFDCGLEAIYVDRSGLEVLQRCNMGLYARELAHHSFDPRQQHLACRCQHHPLRAAVEDRRFCSCPSFAIWRLIADGEM